MSVICTLPGDWHSLPETLSVHDCCSAAGAAAAIDTAEMYGNEQEVGQGLRVPVDRADVFITSKLNNGFHKPDDARRAFDSTLRALESD